MTALPQPLAPLAQYNQFLLFKIIPDTPKPRKVPIDPRTLDTYPKGSDWQNDPDATVSAEIAVTLAAQLGPDYGVAFLFTASDPFWFLDIDNCLVGDQWSVVATDLMTRLSGCAVEVSTSGKGLHIFGSGPVPEHSCRNQGLGLEFYTEKRFVALTGDQAVGDAATVHPGVAGVVAEFFPPTIHSELMGWTDTPVPEWGGPDDDAELLARAMKSKPGAAAAFGGRSIRFRDLWEAEPDVLAAYYPDSGDRAYDASAADAALAQHLAFWTGKDCERIERIMRQSGLARDKWEREDYLPRTIGRAVSIQRDVYCEPKAKPLTEVPQTPVTTYSFAEGPQYLPAALQPEYFQGCCYVIHDHAVLLPSGALLDQGRFNAAYGGYEFQLTDDGKSTKKAWEAFTESQVVRYQIAERTCFRPELPRGEILYEGNQWLVNSYVPYDPPRAKGDLTPFLDHVRRILPVERDQRILLSYMAACVQHKGTKFQWAPLLQGCEGNGKTLFTRCLQEAVGRRYYHAPKAQELGNKFNAWMRNKLVIGVEDVFVSEHRAEVLEALKPMITGENLELEGKGVNQDMGDICANFIFNSNHKDALRDHVNGRRYAVFFTAQQHEDDLVRDGMDGDYFPKLYNWFKHEGSAIINEFLYTYPIDPKFNPAGACQRAPRTSSTAEARAAGSGMIEQHISEAIEEQRPGFVGDWISGRALTGLLADIRRTVSPNKVPALLESLGYIKHPNLPDGRASRPLPTPVDENKRARLYVRRGSAAATSEDPTADYLTAQSAALFHN
jgi:hypothetical protein